MNKKYFASILPYLAVWAGLFFLNNAWAALLGFHIAVLSAMAVIRPDIPVNILFKSRSPKWIIASVLFCGTSGIGLYFLWDRFGVTQDLPAQLRSMGLTASTWPLFIAYFSLVNPLIEEFFWRGVLGSNSGKLYIGDVIYAAYHALILWGRVPPFSSLFAVLTITFAGWFWRQLFREDDGLLAPVLGHVAADLTILLTIYRMAGS